MSTDDQGVTAEFGTVRRGYDTDQVDQYITALQASTRAEIEACRERLTETESALATAKQREEAVHLMLVAASQTKEEMVAAAKQEVAEATKHAEEDAETIVADAKREAFAVVTDARNEADVALEEARHEAEAIVAKALEEARAIVAEPELHVVAPVADEAALAEAEAAGQRVGELEKKEAELERRIDQLKAVAAELETRMADFARGALGELAQARVEEADPSEQETVPETAVAETSTQSAPAAFDENVETQQAEDTAASPAQPLTDEQLPPVVRKSWKRAAAMPPAAAAELTPTTASVEEAAPPVEPAIADEPLEHTPIHGTIGTEGDAEVKAEPQASLTNRSNAPRGSFYSRRSAKLPRIGVEAGRGALAAVSAMRSHGAHLDDDDADEDKEAGDFAAQSA